MTKTEFAEQVSQHLADFRHEVAKLEMPEESWDSLVSLTGVLERQIVALHKDELAEQTRKFLDDHLKIISY